MGMYDYIKCEYKLPDSTVQDQEFQTKDFDNLMDIYTISKEGKLFRNKGVFSGVPEEERPYYGTEKWDLPFGKLLGCMKHEYLGEEFMPYTGTVSFCAYIDKTFFEYVATFYEGELKKLDTVSDRWTDFS